MRTKNLNLSERQEEIMTLICRGFSPSAIAKMLFLSESTTKLHIQTIYRKLGFSHEKGRDLKVRALIQYLKMRGVIKMECQFKKNGVCMSPIPVNCNDECGFKHLIELYNGALAEMERLQTNNEKLTGQYNALLNRYNLLLKEISFTD